MNTTDTITILDATPAFADGIAPADCPYNDAREAKWFRGTVGYHRLVETLGLVADETDYLVSARPASSYADQHQKLVVAPALAAVGMTRQFHTRRVSDDRLLVVGCNEDGTRVAYQHTL